MIMTVAGPFDRSGSRPSSPISSADSDVLRKAGMSAGRFSIANRLIKRCPVAPHDRASLHGKKNIAIRVTIKKVETGGSGADKCHCWTLLFKGTMDARRILKGSRIEAAD